MFAEAYMVKEYLEKTKQGFIEKKIDLTAKENNLHLHIKENIEIIKLLEESTDPNFEAFSPRQGNNFNKQKINELNKEQKVLIEELNEVRKNLYNVGVEIDEIDSVIKVAREKLVTDKDIDEAETSPSYKMTILQTQESERQRIARELHDTTVQCLTSLVHKSELCQKLIDIDPIRCKLELISMSKILRNVIEDTRTLIYDLRPMSFDDIGFDITVERFLDKLKSLSTVQYNFKVEGEPFEIKPVIGLTLLRVIQEACSNSIKHGKASHIHVTLNYVNKNIIELIISDDGTGFDVSSLPESIREDNSGFGLSMMKERIYLLSGDMKIVSSQGNGCIITVEVPHNKED